MIYDGKVEGKYVSLRPVTVNDAEFVIQLRTAPEKCRFIHETSSDIDKQIEWIKKQNLRENDYYFVSTNRVGPIGLSSVYNIDVGKSTGEFGRWISAGNPLETVETAILSLDFGFDIMNLNMIYMLTVFDNAKTRGFWKHFGVKTDGIVNNGQLVLEKEVIERDDYKSNIRPRNVRLLKY